MREIKTLFALCILLVVYCSNAKNTQRKSWDAVARREMVDSQIIARGIGDENVINAMLQVERHKFVPEAVEKFAYSDCPLPIGEGQTISQPYVVALMTEALHLKEDDTVLEIGTGSGYQAAVLSLIVKEVYTIEIVPALASAADERLKNLGYKNVHVKCGDGFLGWPEHALFDGIIITCAPPEVPKPLIEQLAEGGSLVVPLGEDFQMLTLFKKKEDLLEKEEIIPVRFVPMKGLIEER